MSLLDHFDFFHPDVSNNPYPYFAELREKAPLFWLKSLQVHVLSRYEDVAYVLKNPALFSSVGMRINGRPVSEQSPSRWARWPTSSTRIRPCTRGCGAW
jgi:cytochrome P450